MACGPYVGSLRSRGIAVVPSSGGNRTAGGVPRAGPPPGPRELAHATRPGDRVSRPGAAKSARHVFHPSRCVPHDARMLSSKGEDFRAFWTERHLCTLTTIRPDGTPHVVPVGVTLDVETATRSCARSNRSSWKSGWPLYQATSSVADHEPGRSSPGIDRKS